MTRILASLLASLLVASCGGTEFSGNSAAKKKEPGKTGRPGSDEDDNDGKTDADAEKLGNSVDQAGGEEGGGGEDLGTIGVPQDLVEGGDLIKCPKEAQSLLILDFKSGWWAGDGGDFFQKVLDGLHQECKGSIIIEYHHIVQDIGAAILSGKKDRVMNTMIIAPGDKDPRQGGGDFATAFVDASWGSYTQVWILSGAHADELDVRTDGGFYTQVMEKARTVKANLFVGAGYGSITHGNAVAQAAGLGVTFGTSQEEGRLLDPMSGAKVLTTLGVGDKLEKHVLFTRGIKAVADDMMIGKVEAKGDFLSAHSGAKVIAHDTQGRPVMAVTKLEGRVALVDAGMQRYYAIWQDQSADTFQLLKNIIVFLSQ